jgi:hypothetical protein
MQITSNSQEPFVYGSLGGDKVVLARGTPDSPSLPVTAAPVAAAPAAAAPAPAAVTPPVDAAEAWRDYEVAARLNTIPVWDEFLKTYSTGFISHLARGQRAKLLQATPAPTAPAATPAVAAIPAEAATRALPAPEPSSRQRRKETKRTRAAKSGGDGGGSNSEGCAAAKRTLKAAMAMGFDNRDGVITAVRAKCGR